MRQPPHQRKGNRDGGVYFNVQPYQPSRQTSHPHHYAQGKKIKNSILFNSKTQGLDILFLCRLDYMYSNEYLLNMLDASDAIVIQKDNSLTLIKHYT